MKPVRRPPNCTCGIQSGGARTHTRPFSPTSRVHDLFCDRKEQKSERSEKLLGKHCESEREREGGGEKLIRENIHLLTNGMHTVVAPERIGEGAPTLSAQ